MLLIYDQDCILLSVDGFHRLCCFDAALLLTNRLDRKSRMTGCELSVKSTDLDKQSKDWCLAVYCRCIGYSLHSLLSMMVVELGGLCWLWLSSPFIAYHAWKLVCCPTPNLLLRRQWFQRRRFNKYLNGGIWVWGWGEGSSLALNLTLYLH